MSINIDEMVMKKSTDPGFFYCPYIPQLDTTWQAYLTKLQADYVAWTKK
jgi:hypothetical protein